MNKAVTFFVPAALLALVIAGTAPRPANAQLDPGIRTLLYENGIQVGEIYVPERAAGQTQYDEEWVLYPNYRYPGPGFIGSLEIVASPTEKAYESLSDFLQRAPFPKGSKHVHVMSQEHDSFPGR